MRARVVGVGTNNRTHRGEALRGEIGKYGMSPQRAQHESNDHYYTNNAKRHNE